ncbi:MAG TPA: M1 family aminopeptidase [Chitinophagales bacterium]|nr:M1 family aminopeptidase [Chitinophagales bacterium]
MKRIMFSVQVIGVLMITFSCSTTKNSQTVQISKPNEDTMTVEIPENSIAVTPQVYRASYSIINDIVHSKLDVKLDWQKQYLYGKEWLTLKPHFYSTDSLTLDAKGMDLNKIELVKKTGNVPLTYSYDSLLIHIHLDKIYKQDEQYTIFIDYTSKPNELTEQGSAAITDAKGLYFINADNKDTSLPRQVWTQGETESNSAWFPTIDKPNLRTTIELSMTVEDGFVSLSNGLMTSSKENGDGTHTDSWKLDQPIAPYLVMMAAGPFAVVKDHWKNIEVNYYVDKKYEQYARNIFGHTPEMIQHFSDITGVPFVWPKFSQVIVHDFVSGAMENATAVVHGSFVQQTVREMIDGNEEDVISHELFHHWFGDLVTCESWSNITLNESFADYGEYLWNEYKYGKDEADYRFQQSMNGYLAQKDLFTAPLVRYYYNDREEIFDGISYNKGGRVLHMLRNYVGDDAFFKSLHEYLTAHEFGTAEVDDLRLAFEKITGEDLHWFFNQWYFDPGNPKLNISSQYNPDQHNVAVTVEQTQDTKEGVPIFKLPVVVDVYVNGSVHRYQATFDQKKQTVTFPCEAKPDLVNFDAEKMLLCSKNITQSDTAYAFQYNNAPRYLDRMEAVSYFRKKNPSSPFYNEIISKALNDPFWNIRIAAVNGVKSSSDDAMKNKVAQLAASDKNSHVRAGALDQLVSIKDPSVLNLTGQALDDSSYYVIATALEALSELDSTKAYVAAQKLENENSADIADAVMSIYSSQAGPEKNDFLLNKLNQSSEFGKYQLLQHYGAYLARNISNEMVLQKSLPVLYDLAERNSHWWLRLQAMNALVAVQTALKEEKVRGNSANQLEELTQKITQIKSKETDDRLRSVYGLK